MPPVFTETHVRPFPPTAWTRVLRSRTGAHPEESRAALEDLCRIYWNPVFSYLRALGCSREQAQDVAQEFFASFLRSGGFQKADPSQGRLRAWVKQSVRHHLARLHTRQTAGRRGGGVPDESLGETAEGDLPASDPAADETYDAQWAWTVMDETMRGLREAYVSRGKGSLFDALRPALLRPDDSPGLAELAAGFGISVSHVSVEIHRARRRLAAALRQTVADTIEDPALVDDELRYILSALLKRHDS